MDSNDTLLFVVAAIVTFVIGMSKGGLGGTAGALATPLMVLVLPADEVIGLILPVLMVADLFAVALYWGRWNRRLILLLLPGTLIGVTIGTFFITNAPTETLRRLLGVIVLFFALYKLLERRILSRLTYKSHDWHGLVAGIVTGFSSALAHTGGPPVSIYLLMQNVTPAVFIATSALFFMILNWIKVPYYIYADLFDLDRMRQLIWLLPLVPIGAWTGRWVAFKVNRATYENIIIVLLIINSLFLILI
ncbi:MAG: sulfite exporter TauE/SafE family protein [Anaerolineae bacterium]|nr:MAG: sulfite exporter TauE/SafE family protein [Anaerolineae bacterium]